MHDDGVPVPLGRPVEAGLDHAMLVLALDPARVGLHDLLALALPFALTGRDPR